MDISAALVAQTALTRQVVALSVMRQNADAARQMADMIAETVAQAPAAGGRGGMVDIRA